MVIKYLAAAAISVGATYGIMRSEPVERIVERCVLTDDSGSVLEIEQGPLGPRLGGLDYVASNLTHEEKVRLIASESFDTAGIVERMASDLIRSSDRVARDVYRSLERSLREGF